MSTPLTTAAVQTLDQRPRAIELLTRAQRRFPVLQLGITLLAFLVGAPLSGGSLPYGNPGEGAAAIYEDGGLLMRDGFEP